MATEKEPATEEKELIFGEPESATYDALLRKVAFTPGNEPVLVDRSLLHFRISERLGAGGMGTVYKALDEKLQRHVALKVLTRRQVSDEETTRALFREARLAARLGHPNIAAIYEVHDEGVAAVPRDAGYVEGRTLRAELALGPIPPARAPCGSREDHRAAPLEGRACHGHRAPGPQAGQRDGRREWRDQAPRLRHRHGVEEATRRGSGREGLGR